VLEEPIFALEALVLVSLLIASIVAIVVRRIRIPYTVALVLVGLFVAVQGDQLVIQFIPDVPLVLYEPIPRLVQTVLDFDPEFILAIFIPPIIFEAAFRLEFDHLRSNLVPILILAVPGVILSTLIIGGIVMIALGWTPAVAIVFGALISATDPVAVVGLFRNLGVPRALSVSVEGESLFNDGVAIVIFDIALAAALAFTLAQAGAPDGADVQPFTPIGGLVEFVWVSLGGLGIGALLAWLVSGLIFRVDDYFVEITLTGVLAYATYLIADEVGVSGVLAVVAAGIVAGTRGRPGMSPTTRIVLFSFWDYVAFLANSLIFLLIGIRLDIARLVPLFSFIMLAVIAVLVARAIVVYGLLWMTRLGGSKAYVPMTWRHVFFWGGLRGAISLALALSLSTVDLGQPELVSKLQVMAFGVVLFTLLGQGTTIQFLLKRLGLADQPEHIVTREMQLGRLYAAQAGLGRLAELRHDGLLVGEVWLALRDEYDETSRRLSEEMVELFAEYPDLERGVLLQARREALQAERAALGDALRQGLISEQVYRELTGEVDDHLGALTLIREATALSSAAPEE
jgi:CPA1 family monovalent cation:H+ antiporter